MERLDFLDKLGIKNLDEFNNWDEWYDYMINDYIPEQGKKEMEAFLNAGFNINAYLLWKCKEDGECYRKESEGFTR